MSKRFEQNASIDLSAMYAADDAHFGRNALGAGVVSCESIIANEFRGLCGECGSKCGRSLYECMDLARPPKGGA